MCVRTVVSDLGPYTDTVLLGVFRGSLASQTVTRVGESLVKLSSSLVPRPHPLTRRNGLVNQVEFLGLAHPFATL